MTSILVCGLCPLPFENTLRSFAPGIRSWQFAYSLARRSHTVHLVALEIDGSYAENRAVREEIREGVRIERLKSEEYFDPATIVGRIEHLRPDAVVGATIYGSSVLARASPEVPFWADQFGHVMAEAQAKANLEGGNWPLSKFWNLLEPVLRTADRVSVVSRRQRFAAIGELGLVGRLTAETCGYEFISVIPCALTPSRPSSPRRVFRGNTLPEGAFVVLWSGGYNVWSDVDTLFRALETAMDKEPAIHFVSTGGVIIGHDERTYRGFEQRIEASPHRERYHLHGWVAADQVPGYEAEADLGVLLDIPMYEGILGSKNRLAQWMGNNLPFVYNKVGDMGELLAKESLGLTVTVGDAAGLAEKILWAASHQDELRQMAERAREYSLRELSFEATTRELLDWACRPSRAPDVELRRTVTSPADFAADHEGSSLAAKLAEAERHTDSLAADLVEARSELAHIHRSKMWRLWMAYQRLRRLILRPFK